MATKAETISDFRLYMDDTSELSSAEESALYDKYLNMVSTDRPWEATKKQFTGAADGSNGVDLPDDFAFLVANNNFTESASEEASNPVIYVGTDMSEYIVVSWSDRRSYRDRNNVAFIDIANSRLVFIVDPGTGKSVEFDYHSIPDAPADDAAPWFPERFHAMIYHGMCSDSFVIQQSEKARSYRQEHLQSYDNYLRDMAYWNANLVQM